MQAIRPISLVARVALMMAMLLGLVYWIAQAFAWSGVLTLLGQISSVSVHEWFGAAGVLGLFILGGVAARKPGSRLLGAGGMIYALVVPAFGLMQTRILVDDLHWLVRAAHLVLGLGAMGLAQRIEHRYRRLELIDGQGTQDRPVGTPYPPMVARLARLATIAHVALYRLSSGAIGGSARHMPVLLLTTSGRKSGRQHTTPLVYMPDGDRFVVVASNGGQARLPNWWLNTRESKQAHIEIGSNQLRVRVHEADPEERRRLWPRVVACGAGHETYQQRTPYPLPLVVLTPAGEQLKAPGHNGGTPDRFLDARAKQSFDRAWPTTSPAACSTHNSLTYVST